MRVRDKWSVSPIIAALLVAPSAIHAQATSNSSAPSTPSPVAAATPGADAGDIIVTANKRVQRLQDVGLTIASVGQQEIQRRGINSLADIAQAVPGLSYSNSQNNTPVFTLRGVGFYDTSLAAYPTTSIYLDQVPLPFPVLTTRTAFDLERVEVLKGPQGTLFGNNATGGAINYIAAKPTKDFTMGGTVTYARFNDIIGEAYIGGPITDQLRGRLSFKIDHGDGWQESYTRNDSNGRSRSYAARALLDWDPTQNLHFELNANGWIDRSQPQAPQFIASTPQFPPGSQIASYPLAPRNDRAADWSPDVPPSANNRLAQVSLRTDLALSDNLQLTSITSYIHYNHFQNVEGDGTSFHGIDLLPIKGKISSFSQEARISNGTHGRFRWIAGGNYSSDNVSESDSDIFGDASASTALGIKSLTFFTHQRMKNYAGFANGEFDLVPNLTIKGGVRYTQANRSASLCSNDPITGTTNVFFTNLSRSLTGEDVPAILPTECYALQADNLPSRTPFHARLNEHNVSWRGGVDWKVVPGTLLYANISKGYKAGSFPTLSASSVAQYQAVKQESVLAYEAGFKAQPFGRILTINGAGFYYNYSDKQLKSRLIDPVFGALDVLQNIPKSSVRGGEIEATLQPNRQLTINTTAVYTDAKVDRFVGVNGAGVVANFDGAAVPFSPKWRATVSANYTHPISEQINAFLGGEYSYQSRSVTVIGGEGLYTIRQYGLLDLRIGVEKPDGRWSAFLFGKNITNKFYTTNVFAGNDEVLQYTGRPATYGITVAFKYR